MRRALIFLLLMLCASIGTVAQTTSVSGTITDSGGQAWAFGYIQFQFKPAANNPTAQYFQNGVPFDKFTLVGPIFLDGTGSFVGGIVPDNSTITPSGSTYDVQVCPQATVRSCFTKNMSITGGSLNVTGVIVPPPVIVDMHVPLLGARAYTDAEVIGGVPGVIYFNIFDNHLHLCIQTGFPPCTWVPIGGGGGGPGVTSVAQTLTVPSIFTASVVGSPITSVGTLADTISLIAENADLVFAGPCGGGPAIPTFRALCTSDLPFGPGVTSVSSTLPVVATPNPIIATGNISCPTCVTAVTGTSPIVSTGGTTPAISCPTCVTSAHPVKRLILPLASCIGGTGTPAWDTPTSNAAVGACAIDGVNGTAQGVLQYADNQLAYYTGFVPADWSSWSTAHLKFSTTDTTSGHTIIFQLFLACVAPNANTPDTPAYGAANNFTTVTIPVAAVAASYGTDTSALTGGGCAANDIVHMRLLRSVDTSTDASVAVTGWVEVDYNGGFN